MPRLTRVNDFSPDNCAGQFFFHPQLCTACIGEGAGERMNKQGVQEMKYHSSTAEPPIDLSWIVTFLVTSYNTGEHT